MVCATLFNWVDVSVACTSTPRLSVNQATACCCAVLIIAHSTVNVLHGGVYLDTVCCLQALQWGRYNVRTRHSDQAGLDLKKNIFSNVCCSHTKARCLVWLAMLLLSDFLEFRCDYRTQGDVKAVAQELINDVNQDVLYYAKLALAQWAWRVLWCVSFLCVQHGLQQNKDQWIVRGRMMSSCYCTCRKMISTSSYGRHMWGYCL